LVVEHRAHDGALIDALASQIGVEQAMQLAQSLGLKTLPGDKARPVLIDHTTGETEGTDEADDSDNP
jgi:hypothetical protein